MGSEIIDIGAGHSQSEPNNKFWMVWNPSGSSARYRHKTEESARTEAQRLARQAPTDCFIVLEAIARYEAAPPINTTELDTPIGDDAA